MEKCRRLAKAYLRFVILFDNFVTTHLQNICNKRYMIIYWSIGVDIYWNIYNYLLELILKIRLFKFKSSWLVLILQEIERQKCKILIVFACVQNFLPLMILIYENIAFCNCLLDGYANQSDGSTCLSTGFDWSSWYSRLDFDAVLSSISREPLHSERNLLTDFIVTNFTFNKIDLPAKRHH